MVIEARENGNLSKKQREVIELTIFYEGFRVLNPQPLTIYVQCTLGISCSNKSYKKATR
jgi:hypothetical protein